MVHVFSEHLSPVEESAGNKKNRRAQRFGELQLECDAEKARHALLRGCFALIRSMGQRRGVS